jgi:AraC-like DNA-binding protein
MGISWFGCWSRLSLWATLCFEASSRTVGISRSACSTLFGMYHGAFTTVRNTLFCERCKISMLDWEAVPQRGIPYVHIGRSIVLYSRILFSIDSSDRLPMIQYILLNDSSNCFLLAWMCVRHVSRRFRCTPRYVTASFRATRSMRLEAEWGMKRRMHHSCAHG